MTRNTRVNLSRQSRFHKTNNFIPTGMLMKVMDERLYSNLTPDHWGMTTSLHKRHKLGVSELQKRPFFFQETVVLPLKWHLFFNDVMKENDLYGTAANLFPEDTTLHLPFLHTPSGPFLGVFHSGSP